jgi:hypothetical protein
VEPALTASATRAAARTATAPTTADVCERGLCRPTPARCPSARRTRPVPAGRLCVDAICRTPCMTDGQCGPGCSGTVCAGGFCVMPEELVPPACPATPVCGVCGGLPLSPFLTIQRRGRRHDRRPALPFGGGRDFL